MQRSRPLGAGGHRPGLDGVRALAVLGVLLYHGHVPGVPGGFLGVDVFFVLSGFLITSLLLGERGRTGTIDLVAFWLRRARRLLPAAVLVVVAAVVAVAVLAPGDLGPLRGDAVASLFYVNNWHEVLAQRSYFTTFNRPSPLLHYWSLSVEEQFYLLWPVALLVLARLGRARLAVIAALGAVTSAGLMAAMYDPLRDPSRVYFGTDTRAMPLLVGIALACVWPALGTVRAVGNGARRMLDIAGLLGLGTLIAAAAVFSDADPVVYRGGLVAVAIAAALLIGSAAHPASRLSAWLGSRPFVWVGERSYGIYLWHWPVMVLTRPGIDVTVTRWALVPAQIAVTVVLAALSYRYVEMPFRAGAVQRWLRDRLADLDAWRRRAAVVVAAGSVAVIVAGLAVWPVAPPTVPFRTVASTAAQRDPAPFHGPADHDRVRRNEADRRGGPAAHNGGKAQGTAESPRSPQPPRHPILAIGASVMLAALDDLQRQVHARVDAAIGRQADVLLARLRAYRERHALPPVVVVQIGDNGPLSTAQLDQLRRLLTGVPRVVLVNLRDPAVPWTDANDRALSRLASSWPQATLADWRAAAQSPKLFWDGAHPNAAGAAVYARVVQQAIDRPVPAT